MRTSFFLLLLMSFFYSCSSPKVEGVVTNGISNEPISGVLVTISGLDKSDSTTAEGKYLIKDVPIGDLIVKYSKSGFVPVEEKVSISEDRKEVFHSAALYKELSESIIDSLCKSIGVNEVKKIKSQPGYSNYYYKYNKYKIFDFQNDLKSATIKVGINIKGKSNGTFGGEFNLNKLFEVKLVNTGNSWKVTYLSEGQRGYFDI
ncbi:MAG: carboxypeptidase-like regulatory domain-containing protein [Bacteroidetes bacterium]|nr:carboxypeptidase-like regulatory domain-containing protein [Bacteroidota bacterium]